MKKVFGLMLMLTLLVSAVYGMTVESDPTNEFYVGPGWSPAVAVTWIHPEWTNKISIPATWIWDKAGVTQEESVSGSTVTFRKVFEVPTCSETEKLTGSIDVTTDNDYDFSVNGNFVDSDSEWRNVETYDISSYLQNGVNTFTFEAENEAMADGTPQKNPAGLIYKAEISCINNEVPEFTYLGALAGLALVAGLFVVMRRN